MTSVARSFSELPQFARFLICGGVAAGVNWSSRFAWSDGLPFGLAVIAAYCTGMVVAFVLFRTFVFEGNSTQLSSQVHRFVVVNLIGMAATDTSPTCLLWLCTLGMTTRIEQSAPLSPLPLPTATSWDFGHRLLTRSDEDAHRCLVATSRHESRTQRGYSLPFRVEDDQMRTGHDPRRSQTARACASSWALSAMALRKRSRTAPAALLWQIAQRSSCLEVMRGRLGRRSVGRYFSVSIC